MSWRTGVEEMTMQEDVKGEFRHLKEGQDRVEAHLKEQDRHQSDLLKEFTKHVLVDQEIHILVTAHLKDHQDSKKHKWAIVIGIIVTAIGAIGTLAERIISHFLMK